MTEYLAEAERLKHFGPASPSETRELPPSVPLVDASQVPSTIFQDAAEPPSLCSDASAGVVSNLKQLDELWFEALKRFGVPFLADSDFGAADAFFVPVPGRWRTFGLENWLSQPRQGLRVDTT